MDHALFHLINQKWTSPALDLFMGAITEREFWAPFLIAIGISALLLGGFRERAFIACVVLSMLVASGVNGVLKSIVDRPRPKHVDKVRMVEVQSTRPAFLTLFEKPTIRFSDSSDRDRGMPSFPSAHMTTNTVIAVFCTLFYRRWGWLYWFVATAIGYSRVYTGAHWPGDVIGAFFLGIVEAPLLLSLYELVWRSVTRKWMPQLFVRHPSLIGDFAGRARPQRAPEP
jgi:membrane-associated phospholipid phosphatase